MGVSVAFAVAAGFVLSGVSASAFALVTDKRLRFEWAHDENAVHLSRLPLLLVAGPLIIMRNACLAAIRGLRPVGWLFLSTVIAAGWSFCLGMAALNLLAAVAVSGT